MKKLYILALLLSALGSCTVSNNHKTDVQEYMDFLYSRMPVADSIDHPADFWRANVQTALEARRVMPWGASVPEREFRHFVLPVRVNNEDLDSSRMVFYAELAPRVKDMTMEQAALEVNHWCHEQATYAPSDGRTSSPLATVRTALGRCGEESTLAVAALRSVGIPARQVYTPRWAHTDDNHAWVEVWIDGDWHFLGACEPEPLLDMAWFNAPASRGMLMGTNVFGRYDGPEQQLYTDSCYTRINVTSNYAPLRDARVRVVDMREQPVADARVSFRLYNYAEYYSLFDTRSDADGYAMLRSGKGDLVAMAADSDGNWGLVRLPADSELTTLRLDNGASFGSDGAVTMLLTPPLSNPDVPVPTAEQTALNDSRKVYEDSLRAVYTSTFFDADRAAEFIDKLGDSAKAYKSVLTELLIASRGNHSVWTDLLTSMPDSLLPALTGWTQTLTQKDLRDVSEAVLTDGLAHTFKMSPRISNERLTPFYGQFDNMITAALRDSLTTDISILPDWVTANIANADSRNPNRLCISPAGVYASRMADSHSRDIFFCAIARWMGVPARIDEVTGRVLWNPDGMGERVVDFAPAGDAVSSGSGVLVLTYPVDKAEPRNPGYYTHFTLSRMLNGVPRLLEYPETATVSDFKRGVSLEAGTYLLTTGRRLADGGVLARTALVEITPDSRQTMPLIIDSDSMELTVVGSVNADKLLPYTGRGFFIASIISPGHEPTAHLLNELADNRAQLEQWGKKIVLLFADDESAARWDDSMSGRLPSNVVVVRTPDPEMLTDLAETFGFTPDVTSLPVTVVADSFNRVVFHNEGYNPGLGVRLSEIVSRIKE